MNAGRSKDSHVIEDYHYQAIEYILKALRIDKDDGGDKEQAVQWYKKGIVELERGIAVELTGQEDRYDLTKRLQDSMIQHLTTTRDELSLLEATLASERRSNPPSSSNHVLPQPKPVPTSQPATRGVSTNIRPSRPPLRPTHTKVIPRPAAVKQPLKKDLKNFKNVEPQPVPTSQPAARAVSTNIRPSRTLSRPANTKVAPRAGKAQNGRPAAVKQPPKRDLKSLKNVNKNLADYILSTIVDSGESVSFEDIVGQTLAKKFLRLRAVLPAMNPDPFFNRNSLPLFLFGPPGTGKTMLAKAVAAQSNLTFFHITLDSLPGQEEGESESESMPFVRELFAVARELQPSVIFVDNVDLLGRESLEGDKHVHRMFRADFRSELDRMENSRMQNDRVVVIGATNRPQDLDGGLLSRFDKKIYVTLPDAANRFTLLKNLLKKQGNPLSETELSSLVKLTEGYSGRDLTVLAEDAEFSLNEDLGDKQLPSIAASERRKVNMKDFEESMKTVRATVDPATLNVYTKWIEQRSCRMTVDQLQTERLCRQQEQTSPLEEMENSRAELDEQEHRN